MSRTAITLNLKLNRFPNQAHYWTETSSTDIHQDPPIPAEDKNFRGTFVLIFNIWWCHVKTIYSHLPSALQFSVSQHIAEHEVRLPPRATTCPLTLPQTTPLSQSRADLVQFLIFTSMEESTVKWRVPHLSSPGSLHCTTPLSITTSPSSTTLR